MGEWVGGWVDACRDPPTSKNTGESGSKLSTLGREKLHAAQKLVAEIEAQVPDHDVHSISAGCAYDGGHFSTGDARCRGGEAQAAARAGAPRSILRVIILRVPRRVVHRTAGTFPNIGAASSAGWWGGQGDQAALRLLPTGAKHT